MAQIFAAPADCTRSNCWNLASDVSAMPHVPRWPVPVEPGAAATATRAIRPSARFPARLILTSELFTVMGHSAVLFPRYVALCFMAETCERGVGARLANAMQVAARVLNVVNARRRVNRNNPARVSLCLRYRETGGHNENS